MSKRIILLALTCIIILGAVSLSSAGRGWRGGCGGYGGGQAAASPFAQLTDEQQTQAQEMITAFREQQQANRALMYEKKVELQNLLAADPVDEAAVNLVVEELNTLRNTQFSNMVAFKVDMKETFGVDFGGMGRGGARGGCGGGYGGNAGNCPGFKGGAGGGAGGGNGPCGGNPGNCPGLNGGATGIVN